jgi:hypothetical protein
LTKGRTLLHGQRWAAKEIETAVDSDGTQKKKRRNPTELNVSTQVQSADAESGEQFKKKKKLFQFPRRG